MKVFLKAVVFTLLIVCTLAVSLVQPTKAKSQMDCFFCYEGWVFIQEDCSPEYPGTNCYFCNSTYVTIACIPQSSTCIVVNSPEPCIDGVKGDANSANSKCQSTSTTLATK